MNIWLNSRGLTSIGLVSSSADIRRSRGEFDRIKRWFVINPAPIESQSSLNAGGSRRTQDLAQKSLNSFMIQSRVLTQRKRTPFYRRKSHKNCGPSDSMKTDRQPQSCEYRGPRSHDPWSHDLSPIRWWSKAYDASMCHPRSPKRDKSLSVRCPLTRSTVFLCAHACDGDQVDPSPCDRRALCDTIASNACSAAMCPTHLKSHGNIVPHGENEGKRWV